MKGVLKNTGAGWFVLYQVMRDEITSGYDSIQLHPNDAYELFELEQRFDNLESRIAANPNVEFEIVEEWKISGMVKYAKLKNI
jgi:hypothetical protein